MGIVKNKNRFLFNITAIITVVAVIFYLFVFSLPHDLHCFDTSDSSFVSNLIDAFENTHHDNSEANNEDNKNNNKSSDNCPICNLSYFNNICLEEQLSNNLILQETNEKPILQETVGFSSYSYFKFFLRSPPSFIS